MIPRQLQLPKNHSLFLFGPRQSGKSTLLKASFAKESTLYIDLLKSQEYLHYSMNPSLFHDEIKALPEHLETVIVDEIQRIPELLNEIHSLIESAKKINFILSGSSARKLKRGKANLLAGRAWTFTLYPFTHIELGDLFLLDKALSFGTLPAVYLEKNQKFLIRTLKFYVETYITEEIRAEALVRKIDAFIRFLPLAADYNGQILNYSSLARSTGFNLKSIQESYQILEDTLLGFYLRPWVESVSKRMIKHPKFFF